MEDKTEGELQKELIERMRKMFVKADLDKSLIVESGAKLYYELTINNKLELQQNPKEPLRGKSAFETDILISKKDGNLKIPKVVIELKKNMTTHDVITYSSKATRHKRVYPYLRYGLIIFEEDKIPTRFFIHNEGIDFAIGYKGFDNKNLLLEIIMKQVWYSDLIEHRIFGKQKSSFYSLNPEFFDIVKENGK